MFPTIFVEYCTEVTLVITCVKVSLEIQALFQKHLVEIRSEKKGRLRLGGTWNIQKLSPQISLFNLNLSLFPQLQSGQIIFPHYYHNYPIALEKLLNDFNLSGKLQNLNLTIKTPLFRQKSSIIDKSMSLTLIFKQNVFELQTSFDQLHFDGFLEDGTETVLMEIVRRVFRMNDQLKFLLTHPKFAQFISESGWFQPEQLLIELQPVEETYPFNRLRMVYFNEPVAEPVSVETVRQFTGGDSLGVGDLFNQSGCLPSEGILL